MEGNSTSCLDLNFTGVENMISNATVTASNSAGVVSSFFAIAIICYTKAYKEHIHRLLLYLSVTAFISSLTTVIHAVVLWAGGIDAFHHWIIVPRLVMGYALTTYYLLLCWVALYILSLARHWVCFKKARRKVLGLVLVLASPLVVIWAVPVYGTKSCVLNFRYLLVLCGGLFLMVFVCSLVALFAITAVIVSLWKMSHLRSDVLQNNYSRRAMVESIPILLFIFVQGLASFVLFAAYTGTLLMLSGESKLRPSHSQLLAVTLLGHLFPLTYTTIPVLLLCQPRVRQRIVTKCCRRGKNSRRFQHRDDSFSHQNTVQQSSEYPNHETSHTHFSSPHESPSSEEDPLISKQL